MASRIRSSSSPRISRVCSSSAPNGSSMRMICGLQHQRAGDRHALAHAAGELGRVAVARSRRGRPARSSPARARRRSALSTPVISRPNSTFSSTVRQGNADSCWNTIPIAGSVPRTGRPAIGHRAGGRLHEAADDLQQRALAAAAGPDDRDELALVDLERDLAHRPRRSPSASRRPCRPSRAEQHAPPSPFSGSVMRSSGGTKSCTTSSSQSILLAARQQVDEPHRPPPRSPAPRGCRARRPSARPDRRSRAPCARSTARSPPPSPRRAPPRPGCPA